MRLWRQFVADAIRYPRHWPALRRARRAIRQADIAFAELARQGRIPRPWGHQVPGRIG